MPDDAAARVDDAHVSIRNALSELDDVALTTLNESEREFVLAAVGNLYDADEAISQRSVIDPHPKPTRVSSEVAGEGFTDGCSAPPESDSETGGDA